MKKIGGAYVRLRTTEAKRRLNNYIGYNGPMP